MENFRERKSSGSVVICAARDENIVIPEQGRRRLPAPRCQVTDHRKFSRPWVVKFRRIGAFVTNPASHNEHFS
jgi:hypothetical protein